MRAGTDTARRVAAAIRALAASPTLPLGDDVEGLIPPTRVAFVHRVPGVALWLWYTHTPTVLTLEALKASPP